MLPQNLPKAAFDRNHQAVALNVYQIVKFEDA